MWAGKSLSRAEPAASKGEAGPRASLGPKLGSNLAPNLVIGTAGHIDHGKTALIRALTGVDTDRLPEEKARGITIELGFAPLELGAGLRVSVVDVPGHEGLVRTMVAGAAGIDLVLLVVAADEGVMPQTREHVAICELLGIERGVVALSKADLVDEEMCELAGEEVRDLLSETRLADAPILALSSSTGQGIEALRVALAEVASKTAARTPRQGPARLPIDRVFAMKGFGTVVTGTLQGSPLRVGEAVEIHPSGKKARVRGLQSHGQSVDEIAAGTRCAINLQGIEVAELSRGEVVTHPNVMTDTGSADLALRWLASAPRGEDSVAVEFLTGTAERRAHLSPIGCTELTPGQRLFARLHVEGDPLPLLPGDRFIVRGFARSEAAGATLGGGVVLDVAPPHRRRSDPALVRELEIFSSGMPREGLRERVRRTGLTGALQSDLRRETGLGEDELAGHLEALAAEGEVRRASGGRWLDAGTLRRMEEQLLASLGAFHAAEPLRPGMSRETLRGSLPENVLAESADLALAHLEAGGEICSEGEIVRLAQHSPSLDAATRAAVDRIRSQALEAGLEPPSLRDWLQQLAIPLERFRDLAAYLEREGELVRAPGDLWFARAHIEALRARIVAQLESQGEIDTQAYKALIGTSRRTAMPLMELFDELHLTRRVGAVRVLRRS